MSLKYQVIRSKHILQYFRHGGYHKLDGPAEIWVESDMLWCQYNYLHRLDGPAIINEVMNSWHIMDKRYSREEYESKISSHKKT